jgi:vacuolar-type H+-ATPase subunit C/Vma6
MPRIAIENLKLIEFDDLISLIGKKIETIGVTLTGSPYGEQISAMSSEKIDYVFLERAIMRNYAETIQKIIKFSSGNIRNLLLAFSRKLEVSNIKAVLRAVKAKIVVDEAIEHIVPAGFLDWDKWRAILETAKNIENVIDALSESKYGKILKQAVEKRGDLKDLTLLEAALDRAVYQEILEKSEKLRGIDRKIVKDVLGIELDAANVKTILKGKELMLNPEIVRDYLMPTAFFDEEMLGEVMKAPSLKNMIERLSLVVEKGHPIYEKLFTQIVKEIDAPLSRLEAILDKAPLEMSLFELREHSRYYNMGFVLAFLNLKWAEVKNLRCIVKGSERKSPDGQVRNLLTIPDEWKLSQKIYRSS